MRREERMSDMLTRVVAVLESRWWCRRGLASEVEDACG